MTDRSVDFKTLIDDPDGYIYELCGEFVIETGIVGYHITSTDFSMCGTGMITVNPGMRWDGSSGPTLNTGSWIRASLVHDCLYRACRLMLLPQTARKDIDQLMYRILREDGMGWFRAQYSYLAVRAFGGSSAKVNLV